MIEKRIYFNPFFNLVILFSAVAGILTACEGVGIGRTWAGTDLLLREAANSKTWLTAEALLTTEALLAAEAGLAEKAWLAAPETAD